MVIRFDDLACSLGIGGIALRMWRKGLSLEVAGRNTGGSSFKERVGGLELVFMKSPSFTHFSHLVRIIHSLEPVVGW